MGGFAPIIVFFVVVSIISSIVKAAKTQQQSKTRETVRAEIEQARLRRLELAKQQAEFRNAGRPASGAAVSRAVPDKPVIAHSTDDCTGGSIHDGYHEGTIRRPQPASAAEGVQGKQGARRASYAPGTTGQGMAMSEGSSRESHTALKTAPDKPLPAEKPENGTEKLMKSIASQPAIVQGVIWSEILGKPLSEQ